jgi:vancomycin resistance protein YoaR
MKITRRIAAICLSLSLIPSFAVNAKAATANAFTLSAANMRHGAGIYNGVIKTLSKGQSITVIGKELGWYIVNDGNTTGYVTDTLVKITDSKTADLYNPIKSNYEKLAEYSTRFSASTKDRNHNIELGAYKTSQIVRSGESFSFNGSTGNSTRTANGWRPAPILLGGSKATGIGGGLCQCSSTIYSAVKQVKNLTILERRPHSVPVGYVPISGEAMVNYGTSNFRFRNDNPFDIYIHSTVDHNAGKLTATVYKINVSNIVTVSAKK